MKSGGRYWIAPVAVACLALAAGRAEAVKRYDPGASDTEIRIGQTMPYSGAASALSAIGKVQAKYFAMLNAHGGINGRTVKLISLDDGYNPAKALEQARRLIESDHVLAMFANTGTAQNIAIERYLNAKKIPLLFVYAGSERFADAKDYPWTTLGLMTFASEARIYAAYVGAARPAAKVAVLYQNDDFGREYLAGFKQKLADFPTAKVVATASYEVTDATVDTQIISLASSGADVFFNASTPKFAAQAIRKSYDIGWRPLQIVPLASNFVPTVLRPAGLEKSVGLISGTFSKSVGDHRWNNDRDYRQWLDFMTRYYPEGDVSDQLNFAGYSTAVLLTKVLAACGDELTRENVMRHAISLRGVQAPGFLPGIVVNTSPSDYRFVNQLRLQRFDGRNWVPFGELLHD